MQFVIAWVKDIAAGAASWKASESRGGTSRVRATYYSTVGRLEAEDA